ncbi:MAG: Maf family protein [Gemmataceae bacterium]
MAASTSQRLILASASAGRRELMEKAGYSFAVLPAHIDEPTEAIDGNIRQYVQHVAWLKAAAVAPRVAGGIVIAADTVGWCDDQVIGKPADEADARRILRQLSGRTHELWSGVVLWRRPDDLQLCWQEVSHVILKPLSDAELDAYLATRTWRGCSGAYAIQEHNDPFLTVVQGTISNVVGLPMETLAKVLPMLG